jgi:hypothetical protein
VWCGLCPRTQFVEVNALLGGTGAFFPRSLCFKNKAEQTSQRKKKVEVSEQTVRMKVLHFNLLQLHFSLCWRGLGFLSASSNFESVVMGIPVGPEINSPVALVADGDATNRVMCSRVPSGQNHAK